MAHLTSEHTQYALMYCVYFKSAYLNTHQQHHLHQAPCSERQLKPKSFYPYALNLFKSHLGRLYSGKILSHFLTFTVLQLYLESQKIKCLLQNIPSLPILGLNCSQVSFSQDPVFTFLARRTMEKRLRRLAVFLEQFQSSVLDK